jgi:hypothetical protein
MHMALASLLVTGRPIHRIPSVISPFFTSYMGARARATTQQNQKNIFIVKFFFGKFISFRRRRTQRATQTHTHRHHLKILHPPAQRPPSPLPSHPSSLSTRAPRLPAFFILLLLSVIYLFINLVLVQRADGLLGALPLRVRRVPRLVALQSLFVCYLFVFG